MKNLSLILIAMTIFCSCKKETAKPIKVNQNNGNLLLNKQVYNRSDTATSHKKKKTFALSTNGPLSLVYAGDGYYTLNHSSGFHNFIYQAHYNYTLYKDGLAIETAPLPAYNTFSITRPLTGGTYYMVLQAIGLTKDAYETNRITIVDKPVAPAGMQCLYRYYNSVSGQHVCTYDWEELGSISFDFKFEKVLGYTYPNATSAPGLKPIYRYYNSSTGSHYITAVFSNYPGFIYEKILGYVGTNATTMLKRSLTKYYNRFLDDHFVCVAPEVPIASDYTKDTDFIFGYVK